MQVTQLEWIITLGVTLAVLLFDVVVIGRRPHEPSKRETGTALTIYIGLAVWGWGGWSAFMAHPARAGAVVAMVAITVAAMFTSGNMSSGRREDTENRWILLPFLVLGFVPNLALNVINPAVDKTLFHVQQAIPTLNPAGTVAEGSSK